VEACRNLGAVAALRARTAAVRNIVKREERFKNQAGCGGRRYGRGAVVVVGVDVKALFPLNIRLD
jgi:hypothetical protein